MAPGVPPRFDDGVALFNAREFWHAHEAWEDLWHEAEDPLRGWLQGLIQVAAAFFHVERGFHATGFVKLMRGAREKIDGYAGDTLGMDFARFQRDLLPWHEHALRVAEGRPLREGKPPFPTIVRVDPATSGGPSTA